MTLMNGNLIKKGHNVPHSHPQQQSWSASGQMRLTRDHTESSFKLLGHKNI